jgi:hypothetical protein
MRQNHYNFHAHARRQPTVRFSFVSICNTVAPIDQLQSWEDWGALWYTNDELEKFRHEAREICDKLHQHENRQKCKVRGRECTTIASDLSNLKNGNAGCQKLTLSMSSRSRGLEARYCLERRRRKVVSLKYIVRSASILCQHDDWEKLAELAQKCNAWATALAIEEATRDFVRAYSEFFTKRKWKRCFDDSLATSRSVRAKHI